MQAFATADAAATALTQAVRTNDQKAIAAIWGADWRDFVPGTDNDVQRRRMAYLAAWDEGHKLVMSGDDKAVIEVGKSGWTLPVPIVKDGAQWRFDVAAGLKEMALRRIGHDELAVIQTLLAIVDAQNDYAALDPMKTGAPAYARRLLSSPGKKDGLYWETKPGEPREPAGAGGGPRPGRRQGAGRPLRLLFPPALCAGPGGARRRARLYRGRPHDRRLRAPSPGRCSTA